MRCAIADCSEEPDAAAPLPLCPTHASIAHDWVAREVGVTDLLPSPCRLCGSRVGVRYPSGWVCAVCEWRHGELPDGDVPPPRVDVVYYLRAGSRIKIGTSAHPRARLAALRFDELLAFEPGDRTVEQRRHTQFATLRYPGSEWFRAERELLDHVAVLSAGVVDPWHRYARWVSERIALRA